MRNILLTIAILLGLYVGHDVATDMCTEVYMNLAEEHLFATVESFLPEEATSEIGELPIDLIEMVVSAKLDELYPELVSECRRPSKQFHAIRVRLGWDDGA